MKTIVAGLLLLLLFFLIPDDSYAHGDHCAKDFWGNCKGYHRHSGYPGYSRYAGFRYRHCARDFWGRCADGRPRWRREGWGNGHYGHGRNDQLDRGVFCQPRRRVVGVEKTSIRNAKRAAEDAWMGAVRYDHGERYQDIRNSKDPRYNCDPSTPVSPALIVKKVYFRCVVEATPCRAPTGASSVDTSERRFEESDDD